MTRGNLAGDTIMAALGLGGSVTVPPANQSPALTNYYTGANPAAAPNMQTFGGFQGALARQFLGAEPITETQPAWAPQTAQQQVGPVGTTPQQAAMSAYEIFKQSTGYQSRLQEGRRGQSAMYSALGTYQSGARDKALARFNQDYASREFGNWLGALGNQQGLGFAGASALAGVSQGSADRLGAISQNSADFATQAAIARAQNQGALYTGIAGAAGQIAGALSSYKPRAYA
jgi:hypothetical protein